MTDVIAPGWHDWLGLLLHHMLLSLLSFGGTVSTLPEMHRYLVMDHHWLTNAQFTASITIAQIAPGPNVLFVAVMGWYAGMNAGGVLPGLLGTVVMMAGVLLPAATLTYFAAAWGHRNRGKRSVRAFKQGMAPLVIALMAATSWLMASVHDNLHQDWPLWLLTCLSVLVMWRTKVHILWLLAAGAILGYYGIV